MKRTIYISLLLFAVTASVGVSCANAKVPAFTMNYEKALSCTTTVVNDANFNGAITNYTVEAVNYDGAFTDVVAFVRPYPTVDETFYRNGYKAKLSKAVKEAIVPPDSKSYRAIPFKIGWC